MTHPLIIAHRGSSHHAPENTLSAFRLAISDGADGIELDVRLAADEVPVCIHDAGLRRTGGRDARVRDLASIELARTDVGSWFDGGGGRTFAGEGVPTLAEALRVCRSAGRGFQVYVEMKCDESEAARLARAVAPVAAEAASDLRIIAASFTLDAIRFVKEADASLETAALFEPDARMSEPPAVAGGPPSNEKPPATAGGSDGYRLVNVLIARALDHGASGLMLHDDLATAHMIHAARLRRLPVTAWTIDDEDRARTLVASGAHAIITNDPARIRRALAAGATDGGAGSYTLVP